MKRMRTDQTAQAGNGAQPNSGENAAAARTELQLGVQGVRAWLVTPPEPTGGGRDGQRRFVPGQAGPYLLVEADEPLRTLNSAPWGGGFGLHRRLVNRQVDKSYDCGDPNAEMEAFLRGQRLDGEAAACMLTAARAADAGVARAAYGAARVTSLVTVGLGNKARAGLALPAPQLFPGTINAIVLVDGAMTDAAMVNAALTATEAKAAALQALDERVAVQTDEPRASRAGGGLAAAVPAYATGTTTDAVLVAATGRGPLHRYAGTATEVGYLIGRTVYDAVLDAGRRYQAYAREAAATKRPDSP